MLASGVVQLAENLIWFVGSLILLFFLSWKLALLMVVVAPIVAVVAVLFRRKIHPAFRDLREQNAVLSTKTQENISGARVVKAFAQEEYEKKSFRKENQEQLRLALRTTFIWSDYVPVLDFLGNLCTPLLLGVGGVMVVNGVMSLGELITFTGYIWMITGPMRSLGNLMNMFTNAIPPRRSSSTIRTWAPPSRTSPRPASPRSSRAMWSLTMWTLATAIRWSSRTSAWTCPPAPPWPSWARPAAARPPSSTCSAASTSAGAARSPSTAST